MLLFNIINITGVHRKCTTLNLSTNKIHEPKKQENLACFGL